MLLILNVLHKIFDNDNDINIGTVLIIIQT